MNQKKNVPERGFVYHLYPLGLLGCPQRNSGSESRPGELLKLKPWFEHASALGAGSILLGPVFQSTSHGYDTLDYFAVDARLGTNADLKDLVSHAHSLGLNVVLDAVFNHTGVDHPRFRAMVEWREGGNEGWYQGIDFSRPGPHGVPFSYQGWAGCMDLAKLDLRGPAKAHLLEAASFWIREFDIDGLRLDAADVLDFGFMQELGRCCRSLKPGFWLMGEVVHGDYGRWVREAGLDSVTNYECYKGLYSSFNDGNMFEIAHSLRRQFAEGGIYRGMGLYSFVDNHDVSRIASVLKDAANLHPLTILLFTMPGIPSVYYGSEWGATAAKSQGSDWPLRPRLDLPAPGSPEGDIERTIRRLSSLRDSFPELRCGSYREALVGNQVLCFFREHEGRRTLIAINALDEWRELSVPLSGAREGGMQDLLDVGLPPPRIEGGKVVFQVPPRWGRVLRFG